MSRIGPDGYRRSEPERATGRWLPYLRFRRRAGADRGRDRRAGRRGRRGGPVGRHPRHPAQRGRDSPALALLAAAARLPAPPWCSPPGSRSGAGTGVPATPGARAGTSPPTRSTAPASVSAATSRSPSPATTRSSSSVPGRVAEPWARELECPRGGSRAVHAWAAQRLSETTAVATAAGIPDYQETPSLSHHPARRRTTTRLRQGSGYEQAEAELCRVEVDKVAVALGPLA
jgi:hypothetical protein